MPDTSVPKRSSAAVDLEDFAATMRGNRAHIAETLAKAGIRDGGLSLLHPAGCRLGPEHLWPSAQADTIAALLRRMASPMSAEYGGLFLLDIDRALTNEAALVGALQRAVGDRPVRNMAAFKANHSALLQYARARVDPAAGVEVASLAEVITACCAGVRPENLVYGNTNLNTRELLACARLGVSAFCFDHVDKLRRIVQTCAEHGLDASRLRLLLRLAAPYASAELDMERFGLDVDKNPGELRAILELAADSSIPLAGLSFHVGMGSRSAMAYENLWRQVAAVLTQSRARLPERPWIIDVGGGFGFDDSSARFLGALSVSDQIEAIGRGVRGLVRQFEGPGERPFQVWSEIGQGSVGSAGSVFARVEFHERRDNPELRVRVSCPTLPGSFLWSQRSKAIYADSEQWLVTATGYWGVPVSRYLTIQPELWAVHEDGRSERVVVHERDLVPTLVFGKSCEPSDSLNPRVGGETIRFLLPDLRRHPGTGSSWFALRLRSGAYMDTAGDFNGQTTRTFPWHYALRQTPGPQPAPAPAPAPLATPQWEYRERLLSPNVVSAQQIQAAKELIAEQFLEREQMITWLRQTGQLGDPRELASLRYALWDAVGECVGSGLSMVRLEARPGQADAEGQVVAALAAKVIEADAVPELPHDQGRDWERRSSRIMFTLEAILLRRARRLDGGLRDKIFPMAYIAMTGKRRGKGAPAHELRAKVLDLARGRGEIKSATSMTTGARSCRVAEQVPGCARMYVVPYADISLHGRQPFAGLRFDERPGELRFYVHDLRGPHRFREPLPAAERLSIDIRDRAHHPDVPAHPTRPPTPDPEQP